MRGLPSSGGCRSATPDGLAFVAFSSPASRRDAFSRGWLSLVTVRGVAQGEALR